MSVIFFLMSISSMSILSNACVALLILRVKGPYGIRCWDLVPTTLHVILWWEDLLKGGPNHTVNSTKDVSQHTSRNSVMFNLP